MRLGMIAMRRYRLEKTAQLNATLFQNMPEFGALCGRIHLNAQ
jgi:hypothetical protein